MRKIFLFGLVAISLLLIAVGASQLLNPQRPAAPAEPLGIVAADGVPRITVQDLHGRLQQPNPPLVWEFRTADTYAVEHLPGSRLVQLEQIAAFAQSLNKQQAIVTLCT